MKQAKQVKRKHSLFSNPLFMSGVIRLGVVALVLVTASVAGIQALLDMNAGRKTTQQNAAITNSLFSDENVTAATGTPSAVSTAPITATNLRAVTGGDSIALLWDMPSSGIDHVEVYRNDKLVGTVRPGEGALEAERRGTRYIDRDIVAGESYSYKVRTASFDGSTAESVESEAVTHRTDTTPIPTITMHSDTLRDYPTTRAYFDTYLIPELKTWYPKLADALAYPDYQPTAEIVLYLDPNNEESVSIGGGLPAGTISINPDWLKEHSREAGAFIHELAHIIQDYPADTSGSKVPYWLLEGVAEWSRDWLYRDRVNMYMPRAGEKLNDGYAQGAYMLHYAETEYGKDIVRKLNIAAHNGEYDGSLVRSLTGEQPQTLFDEAVEQQLGPAGEITAMNGTCLDLKNGDPNNGAVLQTLACNSAVPQKWQVVYRAGSAGSDKRFALVNSFLPGGQVLCIDVSNSGTADGTRVWSWSCNGTAAQEWKLGPDGSVVNVISGKCLDTAGGSEEAGSWLVISACNGGKSQHWNLP